MNKVISFFMALIAFFSALPQNIATFKQNQYKTMTSVEQLDDNIYMLNYQNDYGLDELLEEGCTSVADLVGFAARKMTFGAKVFSLGESDFGCSTFEAFTPEGEHTLARNFDFKDAPCFVLWTHPDNGYSSVSMVDCNFMLYGTYVNQPKKSNRFQALLAPYCCVDGMNEKGLAIAVLQLKTDPTDQVADLITDPVFPTLPKIPGIENFPGVSDIYEYFKKDSVDITTTAMIRAVLDKCATIEEAIALVSTFKMHDSLYCSYHYQVTDASGKSVVLEYINNELHVIDYNSELYENDGLDLEYVTNFYVTKNHSDTKVEEHGMDRAQAIHDRLLEKGGVMTELESMDLLNRVKLNYQHPKYPWKITALWSSVYNSNAGTLKLVAGMDYTKIYTFSVNDPYNVLSTESIDTTYNYDWDFL